MQVEKKKWITDRQIEEAAHLFRTLAEPARLHLVRALMNGGLTVGELVSATGLAQANVSKHLSILHHARLVKREREGNFIRYEISDPCLYELCQLVCGKLDKDAKERWESLSSHG